MPNTSVRAAATGLSKDEKLIIGATDAHIRLLWLGQCLADIDAQRIICCEADEALDDGLYEKDWAIRKEINDLPARTLAGLQVKARAAAIAFRNDTSAECDVAGSFVELSKSIVRYVLALGGADA